MGCDFGEDVLIASPMPQQRFLALLRQRMNSPCPPGAGSYAERGCLLPAAASPED
jgi:hypothetical protein